MYWIEADEVTDSHGQIFYNANITNVLLQKGNQYRVLWDEDIERWRIDRRRGA